MTGYVIFFFCKLFTFDLGTKLLKLVSSIVKQLAVRFREPTEISVRGKRVLKKEPIGQTLDRARRRVIYARWKISIT